MRWAATETPPDSRFLVITGGPWWTDRTSEWFPVLADRTSVLTVQGAEWLPDRAFARRASAYDRVQACANRSAACITEQAQEANIDFTHLYIARPPSGDCCRPLMRALREHPDYRVLYDGEGAMIATHRPGETE